MRYRADPMSRANIRHIAKEFRELLGIADVLYIDVLKILELVMPELFENFSYEIVPKHEMPPGRHADTDVVNHIIRIREDIYEAACNGDGQSRMTVMHEIAHYLLIVVYGVRFDRSYSDEYDVKPYEDPEWQAKALAAEIMCDFRLVRCMNPGEIQEACGVSRSAADRVFVTCRKL